MKIVMSKASDQYKTISTIIRSTVTLCTGRHILSLACILGAALAAPKASASFSNYEQDSGGCTNYFSGNTFIQPNTTFDNSGNISASFSSLSSDGPLFVWDTQVDDGQNGTRSGYYYYGVGALTINNWVNYSLTTINNQANGVINGTVTGSSKALAVGLYSFQQYGQANYDSIHINNSGIIEGIYTNHNSTAAGVYDFNIYGGSAFTNNSGGQCIGAGTFDATGVNVGVDYGSNNAENDGTITAIAYGGQGQDAGLAYAQGFDLFGYDNNSGSPLSFNNTGMVQSYALGKASGTNICFGTFMWAEGGSMTFNNTGTSYAQSTGGCSGAYVGGNRGPDVVNNWGTIQGVAPYGGFGLGVENDTRTPNDTYNTITINNWGTITHNTGYGILLYAGTGYATINNYGTIYGAGECIHTYDYPGNTTVNVYGPVQAASANNLAINLGTGNNTVNIYGLPNIVGLINGGRGAGANNTLSFHLSGVLQTVNGQQATQGNDLSAYNLGSSGSIVVSGQTYQWENFSTVNGSVAGSGTHVLVSAYSGMALDNGSSKTQDTAVIQYWKWGGPPQQWDLEYVANGYYKLINAYSGMALDDASSHSPGADVIQWPDNGGPQQHWMIIPVGNGFCNLINEYSGMALDNGSSNTVGNPVVQYWDWGGNPQQWQLQ